VETSTYELARRLVKKGLEVEVHASKTGSNPSIEYVEGMKVIRHRTLFMLFRAPVNPAIPMAILKRKDTDVIHVTSTYPTISDLGLIFGRIIRRPVVLAYHFDGVADGFLGLVLQRLYSRLFAKCVSLFATAIVSPTRTYAEASPVLGGLGKSIAVIPNGVDLKKFNPCVDGHEVRKRFDIPEGAKVVLFVGRLVPFKGLEYLFEGVSKMLGEREDLVLMIVGEGELKGKLMDLARRMGIDRNVVFTGRVSESLLPHCYGASDLFVLPSVGSPESFGIVLIEAFASGKPVIATCLAGVNEVIRPGVTGLIVPPKDSEALACAIRTLVSNNELRREMGRRARLLAEEKYDWNRIVNRYLEVYDLALERGRPNMQLGTE
jgi:rhamnosyl/mannosyltransferase